MLDQEVYSYLASGYQSDNTTKDRSFLAAIKVYSLNAPIFSVNITFRGMASESAYSEGRLGC
jgi:hypothetical protein